MFIENVRKIHSLYKEAVEEGQNYSEKFNFIHTKKENNKFKKYYFPFNLHYCTNN